MRRITIAVLVGVAALFAASDADAIAFQPFQAYFVGSWPHGAAVGDVTGDGRGDVLVTTGSFGQPEYDHRLVLFQQRPDGGLAAPAR